MAIWALILDTYRHFLFALNWARGLGNLVFFGGGLCFSDFFFFCGCGGQRKEGTKYVMTLLKCVDLHRGDWELGSP